MAGQDYRIQASELWKALQSPEFDHTQLTPQDYKWLGDYEAQGYDPFTGLEQTLDVAPQAQARAAQMDALMRMQSISDQALTADEAAAVESITDASGRARRVGDAGLMEELGARGIRGGGAELTQRLMGGQAAANEGRASGTELRRDLLRRQLEATASTGELGQQVRGTDIDMASRQAQLAQDYQKRKESILNPAREFAANAQNEAALVNTQGRQAVDNATVAQRNTFDKDNLARRNELLQKSFENSKSTTEGQANSMLGVATGADAEQAAKAAQKAAGEAQNWNYVTGGLSAANEVFGSGGFMADTGKDIGKWIGGWF